MPNKISNQKNKNRKQYNFISVFFWHDNNKQFRLSLLPNWKWISALLMQWKIEIKSRPFLTIRTIQVHYFNITLWERLKDFELLRSLIQKNIMLFSFIKFASNLFTGINYILCIENMYTNVNEIEENLFAFLSGRDACHTLNLHTCSMYTTRNICRTSLYCKKIFVR